MKTMTLKDVRETEQKLLKCYDGSMTPSEVADFATRELTKALAELAELKRREPQVHLNAA